MAESKSLQAEVDALDGASLTKAKVDMDKAEREMFLERATAEQSLKRRLVVAQGEFDGKCPVVKIECPATATINNMRTDARASAEEARTELDDLVSRHEILKRSATQTSEALGVYTSRTARLERMREQARRMLPRYEEAKQLQGQATNLAKKEQLRIISSDHSSASAALMTAQRDLADRGTLSNQLSAIEKQLEQLRAQLKAKLAAAQIFGKNGAQRRIAETHLSTINYDANAILSEAEIALDFELRWSREAKGLAKSCGECGAAMPSSERVKSCEWCGAKRGPHLVNRLDVLLSEQSSAAEDVIGVAFQLAASRWLLEQRGSDWSTVVIDEPFAHCDKFNRIALARQLARVLAGQKSFRQAMIVSHTSDVTELFPGRIEILGSPQGSTAKVVA